MKIKLDENLPLHLAEFLKNSGHDVHTVQDEGLTGRDDREVWEASRKNPAFLSPKTWTSPIFGDFRPDLTQAFF